MTRQRNTEVEEAFNTYKAPGRKCWSAQCKWCQKDMAQHTGRQLSHLRLCQPYQRHLREEGIAPSEARQVRPVPGPIKSDSISDSNSHTTFSSSPQPEVRTRAGGCGFKIWTGDEAVTCPCKSGVFAISDGGAGGGEIRCCNCGHRIGNHEDFDAVEQEQGFVLPRTKTVEKLWSELHSVRAIHIRGPPKSGKSTLAGQLVEHVSAAGVQVFNVTPNIGKLSFSAQWRTTLRELGVPETFSKSMEKRLLVIDEAEKLQRPEFESFLNDFVVSWEPHLPGLKMALFSSYGIPRAGAQRSAPVPRETGGLELMGEPDTHHLTRLTPEQRVSIKAGLDTNSLLMSLYFTREEFDEFIPNYFESEIPRRKMPAAVRDFVYNFTGGHPGCLRALLDALKEKTTREKWSCVDVVEIMEWVYNPVAKGGAFMNFPAIYALMPLEHQKLFDSPDNVDVHQYLVSNHSIVETPQNRATLEACHRAGFLHAEVDPATNATVFIFPSLMHRRLAESEWNRFRSKLTSDIFEGWELNIKRMVVEAISRMSRTVLQNRPQKLGPGAEFRPLSRTIHDEFFRAAWEAGWPKSTTVMDQSLGAPPEARLFDFWVESQGYAITISRPGMGVAEYKACWEEFMRRFPQCRREPRRQYGDRNDVRGHVLLDFRTKVPDIDVRASVEGKHPPWLYYVIFQTDYSRLEIFDASGKSVWGPFKLRP